MRDNSVKNQRNITKFELDLHIPVMYLHTQFQPYTMYIHTTKSYRVETKNFFKKDNSVKNHQTETKFKLDLRNPMIYPYISNLY
jgi:hypothetical protein